MKVETFLSPVTMDFELCAKGLSQEQVLRVAAVLVEIAAEKGQQLDLSRLPIPSGPFRRLDV